MTTDSASPRGTPEPTDRYRNEIDANGTKHIRPATPVAPRGTPPPITPPKMTERHIDALMYFDLREGDYGAYAAQRRELRALLSSLVSGDMVPVPRKEVEYLADYLDKYKVPIERQLGTTVFHDLSQRVRRWLADTHSASTLKTRQPPLKETMGDAEIDRRKSVEDTK